MSNEKTTLEQRVARLAWRMVVFGLLAGVVAGGLSLTMPNRYRATSVLLLAPLPITPSDTPGRAFAPSSPAAQVGQLLVRPLSVPDYKLMFTSDEILRGLRDKMISLLSDPKQKKSVSTNAIRAAMEVTTRILKQSSIEVEYQPVIELSYVSSSPELAATMANEWARLAIEMAGKLASKGREGMIDFLQNSLDSKLAELEAVDSEIERLDSEMPVDIWTTRVQDLSGQISKFQIELAKLNADIADAQGQLAKLSKQRESTPPVNTLRKAPPDAAYWMIEGREKLDSSNVLITEETNPVYTQVATSETLVQSELQGMLERKTAVEQQLAVLEPQLADLQKKLAATVHRRTAAQRKADALTQQQQQLSLSVGAAKIADAQKTPEIKLMSEANVPDRKSGPQRSLMVAAAALLAMAAVAAHFFVLGALRQER
ncbi:MAG TPA: hypothetical protein P5318_02195 [Candidatus Hydrogenedentes bacterium]|nr:hypothetical protein [Candidatus Hydrogenedentota bacterium]HRT18911.1 hypothetical protein [Candidatus Hydrogenedentota bacterium]HRT64977.1 hypothetical protein [Candidatus Hydrogenedentota bacterium]